MKYKEFDVAAKKHSDRLAETLRAAEIRFEQRVAMRRRRSVYVICVHPDDFYQAAEVRAQSEQREREAFVRTLRFVRLPYSDRDMLLALEPNEAGYYASGIYHGEPFDSARYRVVRGGWDHEHCYICGAKVLPGDEWWAAHPPNFEDEIGLCLECHAKVFG